MHGSLHALGDKQHNASRGFGREPAMRCSRAHMIKLACIGVSLGFDDMDYHSRSAAYICLDIYTTCVHESFYYLIWHTLIWCPCTYLHTWYILLVLDDMAREMTMHMHAIIRKFCFSYKRTSSFWRILLRVVAALKFKPRKSGRTLKVVWLWVYDNNGYCANCYGVSKQE